MNGPNACLLRLVLSATVLLATDCPLDANAQGFPTRPITAITNVSPGGTYDIFMRALGDGIRTGLGAAPDHRAAAGRKLHDRRSRLRGSRSQRIHHLRADRRDACHARIHIQESALSTRRKILQRS